MRYSNVNSSKSKFLIESLSDYINIKSFLTQKCFYCTVFSFLDKISIAKAFVDGFLTWIFDGITSSTENPSTSLLGHLIFKMKSSYP